MGRWFSSLLTSGARSNRFASASLGTFVPFRTDNFACQLLRRSMLALHHSTLPWSLHEQGLICLPNEEPHILERIRIGEHIEHYETVRLSKNANLIDISLSVSPVKDAEGKIIGASKIARDITERKRAEAHQDMLTRELHHRTKNVFTVEQAVICRSFAGKSTVRQAEAAVLDRLHSLAQTHVMLIEKDWEGADIAEVVRQEMSPFLGRVVIEGPTVMLNAKAAQNFALAVHELATNAVKYGALSNATGRVHIH